METSNLPDAAFKTLNIRMLNDLSEDFSKEIGNSPGWCGLGGWSVDPYTKRSGVGFPVRAHAKVAGLIPIRAYGRQPIDVSLSHFLLLSLKSINMIFKKR